MGNRPIKTAPIDFENGDRWKVVEKCVICRDGRNGDRFLGILPDPQIFGCQAEVHVRQ